MTRLHRHALLLAWLATNALPAQPQNPLQRRPAADLRPTPLVLPAPTTTYLEVSNPPAVGHPGR